MTTQVLVVFCIRTRRLVFRSAPGRFLVGMTVGAVGLAIVLPLLPIGRWFGFVPPPPMFFAYLIAATLPYLALVEVAKIPFYRTVARSRLASRQSRRGDVDGERAELTAIYVSRGVDRVLADQVAPQLMAHDALGAHARAELGRSDALRARPVQAAPASAACCSAGALVLLIVSVSVSATALIPAVAGTSLIFLAVLGALAALVGGAKLAPAAIGSCSGARWHWVSRLALATYSARSSMGRR